MVYDPIVTRNISDIVVEQITDKILFGSLNINDRIPTELELAEQLGVGRSSVREALKALETIGIVKKNGAGRVIGVPSKNFMSHILKIYVTMKDISVKELFQARIYLESTFTELAIMNGTEDDVRELGEILQHSFVDPLTKESSHANFHRKIATMTKNDAFILIFDMLMPIIEDLHSELYATKKGIESISIEEHTQIYEAIKQRDVELAKHLMRGHLDDIISASLK